MERHVTFDLLHDLMDMAVEHGHRAEALLHIERLERASAGNSRFFDFGSGFSLQCLVFAHRNLLKWRSSVVRRKHVRPSVYSPRL